MSGGSGPSPASSSGGGVRRRTPLTVVDHDLRPGGTVSYHLAGPGGDRGSGWWRILAVDAPHRLDFELDTGMSTAVGQIDAVLAADADR